MRSHWSEVQFGGTGRHSRNLRAAFGDDGLSARELTPWSFAAVLRMRLMGAC